jgi:hypothetical protein
MMTMFGGRSLPESSRFDPDSGIAQDESAITTSQPIP